MLIFAIKYICVSFCVCGIQTTDDAEKSGNFQKHAGKGPETEL